MTKVESLNQILKDLNCKNQPVNVVDCLKEIIAILDSTRDLSKLFTIVDCLNTIVAIKTKQEITPNKQTKVECLQDLVLALDPSINVSNRCTISDCLKDLSKTLGDNAEGETISEILDFIKSDIVKSINKELCTHTWGNWVSIENDTKERRKCSICGTTEIRVKVKPHIHDWKLTGMETKPVDDIKHETIVSYTCKSCDATRTEVKKQENHSFTTSTETEGCITTTTQSCSCGKTITSTTENHVEVYSPEQSDRRWDVYVCANCGNVLRSVSKES